MLREALLSFLNESDPADVTEQETVMNSAQPSVGHCTIVWTWLMTLQLTAGAQSDPGEDCVTVGSHDGTVQYPNPDVASEGFVDPDQWRPAR
jgi:hypothetical protein